LLLTAAAYVLHQQLRQPGLQGATLATAQPRTVILSLFKIAVRVKQYKDPKIACGCTCPPPARSKRFWRKYAGGSARPAGSPSCWLLHELARLAHETVPPTLYNNRLTLCPDSGGWGSDA